MRARDALGEALGAVISRPFRALLTALGTVLGVALLVVAVGLAYSANAAISQQFNALLFSEVDAAATGNAASILTSAAAQQRVLRLNGVEAAGVLDELPNRVSVSRTPWFDPESIASGIQVVAATRGALGVIGPTVARGRTLAGWEVARGANVALLGIAAAQQLGLSRVPLPWWIYIAQRPYAVQGVFSHVARHAETLQSVIVPFDPATVSLGARLQATPELVVATKPGYPDAVAASLPAAVDPYDTQAVQAGAPPEPTALRRAISADVTGLLLALAAVGIVIGVVGIANATLVAVLERTQEIGLRRALGARRGQIAVQFLAESVTVGALGSVLGVALGVLALVGVAVSNGWTPGLPAWVVPAALGLGSLGGLLAGAVPAMRAARTDPASTLAR